MKIIYKRLSIILIFSVITTSFFGFFRSTIVNAAASNPTNTVINQSLDLFTYVKTGETADIVFTKLLDSSDVSGGFIDPNVNIVVSRPGASDATCTLAANAPDASNCTMNYTATEDGIWRIRFYDIADKRQLRDIFTWSISVEDTLSADIPGRTWTNYYNIGHIFGPTDLVVWYQGAHGYQYKVTQRGYGGIFSWLFANDVGVANAASCLPVYGSVARNDNIYSYDGACGTLYKLFFEQPASDLPESAVQWDSQSDWVIPPVTSPTISSTNFVPDENGSRSGTITAEIASFNGPFVVHVDIDGDDNIDANEPRLSALATSDDISVDFDGKDANGDLISNSQELKFRILITKTAEIHFTAIDVEERSGGIEAELLNGANAGSKTLYWNDSSFTYPDINRCSVTSVLFPTGGIDSDGGVHGWGISGCDNAGNYNNGVNGSWGDHRVIDDWTFEPVSISSAYVLPAYFEEDTPILPGPPEAGIKNTRNILLLLAACGAAAGAVVYTNKQQNKTP